MAALTRRGPLLPLWRSRRERRAWRAVSVPGLLVPILGDRRHDLREDPDPIDGVVRDCLADDGGQDRNLCRARLAVIRDASAESLREFITMHVAEGSAVVTDGLSSYPGALSGYAHESFNVSASGKPAHGSLSAVHQLFALAKRMIEGTYQGSGTTQHLPEYLDEFVFRFNRRRRGLVFMRLTERAITTKPVTYRELVREPKQKDVPTAGTIGPHSRPGTLHVTATGRSWRKA